MKRFALTALTLTCLASSWAQTDILNESFNNGIPNSWLVVDVDGLTPAAAVSEYDSAWISVVDPTYGDTAVSSTSFYDPAGTAEDYLITPRLSLGGGGNYLYWRTRSGDASFPDNFLILVSTTDSLVGSFTDTLLGVGASQYWTSDSLKFDTSYSNQDIFVAFVNNTDDGFKLYLDDIRVEINNSVGIPERGLQLITYPNPCRDWVYVQGNTSLGHVRIMDMEGRTFTQFNTSSHSERLDITDLSPGMYLVMSESHSPIRIIKR